MTPSLLPDYESLSDRDLAAAVARKDKAALTLFMRRHNQRLFRAAWSILGNRAEAEDAVQDAYMRAFAAIAGFKGEAALSTWLTRIAVNEALMRKRALKRRAAALNANSVLVMDEYREKLMASSSQRASPESALLSKELAKLLETAVSRLPEPMRAVFVLRQIEGMSVEETAGVLDILPDTVKTRMSRARRRLKSMLDPELENALGETFPFAGADCEAMTARVLHRLGLDP